MPPSPERRIAAGEDKAFRKALDHIRKKTEVSVVSCPITGQEGSQGMVKIVVPLGIQAIAAGPHRDESLADRFARWAVDAVALLFPRLDSVTRTEWLLYGAPAPSAYAAAVGGLVLYALLLVAAGLFDFHRRGA